MFVAKTIFELKAEITKYRTKKISFVPTMGALHEGHLSLIKKANELSEIVVVSIFVNKTQFNNIDDFTNYPRDYESDLQKLKSFNDIIVFLPKSEEMLGENLSFKILPTRLVDCLCGKARIGHFDGVALILMKFFNIIKPNIAIFGEKDFQQLMIVKQLVADFFLDIKIIGAKSLREESGLVLSSRNKRLDASQKILATKIFTILNNIKNEVLANKNIELTIKNAKKNITKLGFSKIDYLEIRDEKSLNLITNLDETINTRIFIAVFIGKIRLIDNLSINSDIHL